MYRFVVLAALLTSLTTLAADRQAVNLDVLNQVRDNLKLSEFRVYVSKIIKINRKVALTQNDNTGTGIAREIILKLNHEKLSNNVRGKIITIESSRHYDDILFVSFDKACVEKKCSYIFVLKDGVFKLLAIPSYQIDDISIKTKKTVLYAKWELVNGRHYDLTSDHQVLTLITIRNIKHLPVLEFKLSESEEVIQNFGW